MKKELDIENWERREHYHFFKSFEEPYFGLTVDIDCTEAYAYCKEQGVSFFLFYLYQSLRAANVVEVFRYRIKGEKVFIYDQVHASPTINRENGTFGFAYMHYYETFEQFRTEAQKEIERVRNTNGLQPSAPGQDVVHYSSVPWLKFTSVSHARSYSLEDSCPKIVFGKMTEREGRREMPLSVHAHHALVDGAQVAEYVEVFQRLMKSVNT